MTNATSANLLPGLDHVLRREPLVVVVEVPAGIDLNRIAILEFTIGDIETDVLSTHTNPAVARVVELLLVTAVAVPDLDLVAIVEGCIPHVNAVVGARDANLGQPAVDLEGRVSKAAADAIAAPLSACER